MCNCGCQHKQNPPETSGGEEKGYICSQCNTFKKTQPEAPAPECCGKKMQEMD